MADGSPPKPADDTKKPEGQPPQPTIAPAVSDASANAKLPANENAKPAPELPKIVIPQFSRPLPLPEVKPEAASELKKVEEKKPEEKKPDAPAETAKAVETAPKEKAPEKKPEEKKKPLKVKLFEKGVDAIGFGEIMKAWKSPENRFRNVMKSIGQKAADMVAGRIVSMTFRLIAITWVAGIIGGVSTFGGLALLALATGAASSIYTYGKDYLHDKLVGPKEKRKDVKLWDIPRVKNAGIAFLTGTFNGALGAWLAKTGILQNLFGMAKDFITSGGGLLSQGFNEAAKATTTAVLEAPVSGNVPPMAAAFSIAAPKPELPLVELAYAPNAIPPAVQPTPGFKRY